jgi:threonine synthase
MEFISSRDQSIIKNFKQACLEGQAIDGGLFVPQNIPLIHWPKQELSLVQTAELIFQHFADKVLTASQIAGICQRAFNFPCRLKTLNSGPTLLELFHGPTNAFKDFGARGLAQLFLEFKASGTILVATSGDTGGAVASAFFKMPNIRVVILFPANGVSELQERQLTCWGENILSLKVGGDFDDCQRIVKECFADRELNKQCQLTSANSINLGRLVPQMAYYAWVAHQHQQKFQRPANFYIPTGNMGNAVAALWARQCGAAIDQINMATNANPALATFFKQGTFQTQKSIRTLANAMDVGLPSNLERYRFGQLKREHVNVQQVSDPEIISTIQKVYQSTGEIICPHTACAYKMYLDHPMPDAYVVCTAHPAKFTEVIEPILKLKTPVPADLEKLCRGPFYKTDVAANKIAIEKLIRGFTGV